VATKNDPGLEFLLYSAEQSNTNIEIKSMLNKKFQSWGHGFGVKMESLQKFLSNLPNHDVVMMIDAYDVILTAKNKQELLNTYHKFNYPIVISAELLCNRDINCVGEGGNVTDTSSAHKYLCSGALIGRVDALKQVLKKNPFESAKDDQMYWGEIWVKHKDLCIIDSKSEMFISMAEVDPSEVDVQNGQMTRKQYGTKPKVIHFNGGRKLHDRYFYELYPDAQNNKPLYQLYGKTHLIINTVLFVCIIGTLVLTIILLLIFYRR